MTWKRCNAERYEEMLGCLPPRVMSLLGFLVGEPSTHRRCAVSGDVRATYAAFVQDGGQYYEGPDLTFLEWRDLELADVLAEAKAHRATMASENGAALADALRGLLFQALQGQVMDRDAIVAQSRAVLGKVEGWAP